MYPNKPVQPFILQNRSDSLLSQSTKNSTHHLPTSLTPAFPTSPNFTGSSSTSYSTGLYGKTENTTNNWNPIPASLPSTFNQTTNTVNRFDQACSKPSLTHPAAQMSQELPNQSSYISTAKPSSDPPSPHSRYLSQQSSSDLPTVTSLSTSGTVSVPHSTQAQIHKPNTNSELQQPSFSQNQMHPNTLNYSTGNVVLPAPIANDQNNSSNPPSSYSQPQLQSQIDTPSLLTTSENKIDPDSILDQNPGLSLSSLTLGKPPEGVTPKITTTLWEDEGTLCFQVEVKGVCVARREDNNMINGTKLLNIVGMSRGRRDGILKAERKRHVVKVGAMHFKGVWIPYERAVTFAYKEKIIDLLYPLFIADIKLLLYHSTNYARTALIMSAAIRKRKENQQKQQERQEMLRKKQEQDQHIAQLQPHAQFSGLPISAPPPPPHPHSYYNPYSSGNILSVDPYQRQQHIPQPSYLFAGPPVTVGSGISPNQQPLQQFQSSASSQIISPGTYPNYYYPQQQQQQPLSNAIGGSHYGTLMHPPLPPPPPSSSSTSSSSTAAANTPLQQQQQPTQGPHLTPVTVPVKSPLAINQTPTYPSHSTVGYPSQPSHQYNIHISRNNSEGGTNDLRLESPITVNSGPNSGGPNAPLYHLQYLPTISASSTSQTYLAPIGTAPIHMGTSQVNLQPTTSANPAQPGAAGQQPSVNTDGTPPMRAENENSNSGTGNEYITRSHGTENGVQNSRSLQYSSSAAY